MARINCDEKNWPIVVVRFPSAYSDAEFSNYLSELGNALTRSPRALVLDTRNAQAPAATQRQLLMRFVKGHWQALHQLRGLAFVVDSGVARHALTAVSWVVAKPCPIQLVPSMGEALDWAQARSTRGHVVARTAEHARIYEDPR